MKKLIVSATKEEVNLILEENNFSENPDIKNLYESDENDIFISGIGAPYTIFNLTQLLSTKKYAQVINMGIAGAYNNKINIGDVVAVEQDIFADIGIDNNGQFNTLTEEDISMKSTYPNYNWYKSSIDLPFKKAKGLTVNTVSGSEEKIKKLTTKFNADTESMEGVAVFYICNRLNIPVGQVRAISNYVEPRNKENWEIKKAFRALADAYKTL